MEKTETKSTTQAPNQYDQMMDLLFEFEEEGLNPDQVVEIAAYVLRAYASKKMRPDLNAQVIRHLLENIEFDLVSGFAARLQAMMAE